MGVAGKNTGNVKIERVLIYYKKYLELLSEKYPTTQSVCTEIINLNAILNLPKDTEHFMSDIHGEYEAFVHIMNNCSGEIHDKVDMIFRHTLTKQQRKEICTLIYYPKEKMEQMKENGEIEGKTYKLNDRDFSTVDRENCYELSSGEKSLVKDLRKAFVESRVLREHIDFLITIFYITDVFLWTKRATLILFS